MSDGGRLHETDRRHSFILSGGSVDVTVWKHAVCWDTPDNPVAQDPPFEGVTVYLDNTRPTKTDAQGKVLFEDVKPGPHDLTISMKGYEDVTAKVAASPSSQVQLRTRVDVEERKISYADIVVRAVPGGSNPWTPGRECDQRHAPGIPKLGSLPATLGRILWSDEPTSLTIRDHVWWICGVAMVATAIWGLLSGSLLVLSVTGICAAIFGGLGGIIFGEVFGWMYMGTAAAIYVALMVVAFKGLLTPVPYGLAALTGMWTAFSWGFIGGRRDNWQRRLGRFPLSRSLPFFVPMILGAVAAAGIALLLFSTSGLTIDWVLFGLTVVAALPASAFSGFVGFAFQNEGATQEKFGASDFKLPFLGERYCLQGVRGYWSHYEKEEGGYDWSMPYCTTVLCAKEGHIVRFANQAEYPRQPTLNKDGTYADPDLTHADPGFYELEIGEDPPVVNFLEVRHQDGSLARYEHLKAPAIAGDLTKNALHVRAGHEIGKSDWPPSDTQLPPIKMSLFHWGLIWSGVLLVIFVAVLIYANLCPPARVDFPSQADNSPGDLPVDGVNNYDKTWQEWHDADPQKAFDLEQIRLANGARGPDWVNNSRALDLSYCEQFAWFHYFQPINTLSDLSFVFFGCLLLYMHCKRKYLGKKQYLNRITGMDDYTQFYGCIIIFMGPGSMLYHGTMTAVGGLLDGTSMYGLAGFLCAYNAVRVFNLRKAWFLGIFISLIILFTCIACVSYVLEHGKHVTYVMYAFVGVAFIFQFLALISRHVHTDGLGVFCFWLGGGLIIIASLIRDASQTAGSWCLVGNSVFTPGTHLLQGHAIWHVMSAIGVFLFYFYFAREKSGTDFPRLHFAVREANKQEWSPVKFKDVILDDGQPRSMRKYMSGSLSLGPVPTPTKPADFVPEGGGDHPVALEPLR
jgi:hypothetical protein